MKAILKFDLDDYDQKKQHLRAVKALDLYCALVQLDSMYRQVNKGNRDRITPEEFYSILADYQIDLEELGG